MAWVGQKQLDAAVDAMMACANAMTTADRRQLRILHPAQKFSRRKWEAIVCAALGAASDTPDMVLPEGTYVLQRDYEDGARAS